MLGLLLLLVDSSVGSTSQGPTVSILQGPRGEGEYNHRKHHQGVPKDSTCLHNRLKGTTKRVGENYTK